VLETAAIRMNLIARPLFGSRMLAAALAGIAILCTLHRASADADDSPGSQHRLSAQQLIELAWSKETTTYSLVDDGSGAGGRLVLGKAMIEVSWYFQGKAKTAVLDARDGAWICIRRDPEPTKCVAFLIDATRPACDFVARTRKDGKSACLRKVTDGDD